MIGGAKGIGLGIDLGLVNQYNRTGSQSYIEPEVLDSLVGVWSAYGMTNDSPNRSTIKNKLSNKGGDFVISNAAYDKMSSYGGYEFAKFDNTLDWYNTEGNDSVVVVSRNGHSITLKRLTGPNFWYFQNSTFRGLISNVIPFKVNSNKNISVIWDVHGLSISEGKDKSVRVQELVLNPNEDNYTNLKTLNEEELAQIDISTNSLYYLLWFDLSTLAVDEEVTIEMLPLFEGAFVTDGIDDLITSTKTVQEMGITDEVTVVSMIHQIDKPSNFITTNNIRTSGSVVGRNAISLTDKTGIYGWYKDNIQGSTINVINNILGDKADYTASASSNTNLSSKFSVVGYISNDSIVETSQVAWYWTIIANKVLTTDQINQVIAYFNLDRTLNPDILCNTIKQGITNENHAEFGDKLIDYSGNGRDIQLNNIAWNKESGIDDDGALRLDGVNDFGKVTGMPVYKDYTFIADRYINNNVGSVASKSVDSNQYGAFIFEIRRDNYSFNVNSTVATNLNKDRTISYLSKYSYNGENVNVGNEEDSNSLWIGTIRDNDTRFSNMAIYSLMSFPYSMSEFLIERQLKKHKLGTLYPNMVEFRPIIKSSVELATKPTFVIRDTSTLLNTGDYIPENSEIWVVITMNNAADRITKFVINGNTIDIPSSAYNPSTMKYGFPFTIDSKSPQKITMTIEQDENYVKFEPVITSNVEYVRLDFYLNNYQKRINIGDYIPKDAYLRANLYLKNNVDELTVFTFNGVNIGYRRSPVDDTAFNINQIYNYDSPQEVNITIDEYIRFEDIVQPYPVLLRFNDENGNEVSWGGKFRVGSTITSIGSIADPESNLLNGLYSVSGLSLNGKAVTSSTNIVEKQMAFRTTATWLLDNNEPKVILSPSRLRIPNSSYKILGHIPDISGHGNHGKINNSAYAEGSGVNEDGSYQFDGVDDFVTIPTTVGGKQVLMKVNWNTSNPALLYDQRGYNNEFAIYNGSTDSDGNPIPAYNGRNNGQTYIDGILNKNIKASELRAITHNITITNELSAGVNKFSPVIGSNGVHNAYFTNMALYDFMLFDNISTDDKIKELNKYVGIEGNVWGILTQLSNSTLISNETLIKNE